MSETRPNEMKPKKMVSRSAAMALGIICTILAVGLLEKGYPVFGTMPFKNNYISKCPLIFL